MILHGFVRFSGYMWVSTAKVAEKPFSTAFLGCKCFKLTVVQVAGVHISGSTVFGCA